MKKTSSALFKTGVVLLAVCSLIIAANAGYVSLPTHAEKKTIVKNAPTDFYANITIHVYEGEGCECVPLIGVPINATGRDTDHITSNVTDENGSCILYVQFDKTYRVGIQFPGYESVLFDFLVLDNQPFAFNLKKTQSSSDFMAFAHTLLQKIQLAKKLIK
jgi:hypothetical protein